MAKFKDRSLQAFYEACLKLGNDPSSEFYHDGRPNRLAGHRTAYWSGRAGMMYRARRRSLAYAAWRAGVDQRKLDQKAGNEMPPFEMRGTYLYAPEGWAPKETV